VNVYDVLRYNKLVVLEHDLLRLQEIWA
jgi:hypothetical protein